MSRLRLSVIVRVEFRVRIRANITSLFLQIELIENPSKFNFKGIPLLRVKCNNKK